MSGTRAGGLRAKKTILANSPNFYAEIGRKGGSKKTTRPKGFAHMKLYDPEGPRRAGIKGGQAGYGRPKSKAST